MAEIQPNWQGYYQTGKFNAPVWQGNPGLDDLNRRYNLQQQQQQQNVADFTKELARLNFNGARDPDMPVLHQDYGSILKTFQQYRAETDPKKQQALNLQMRQMQNEFLYKAQQSREANNDFHKDAALAHNPNINLDDSYWKDQKDIMGTSTFDPKYQKLQENKQNWVVPKSDPVKDAQEIAKSLTNTETATSQRYNSNTGRWENVATTSSSIDKNKFMNSWISSHQDPNRIKTAIRETGIQDPKQAVAALGEKMYDMVSGGGKSGEKVTGAGMDYNKILELARIRGNMSNPPPPTPEPQEVNIKIKGEDGGVVGQMNLHNYRAVSIPKATVIPTKAVDDKGNTVDLPAGEVRVIGYADMPVANTDTKILKNGQMVQSNFEQNNPELTTTKPIMHIQVDHKGRTRNYFVDPNAVNVNTSGQKNQNIRVRDVKTKDPLGLFK